MEKEKVTIDGDYYFRLLEIENENEFLKERENKLQKIEQMFKNGTVDLGDLERLVLEI
jgi:hypothetical protein